MNVHIFVYYVLLYVKEASLFMGHYFWTVSSGGGAKNFGRDAKGGQTFLDAS